MWFVVGLFKLGWLTLVWAWRVSMSLEKNFQSESLSFLFAAEALFGFLVGVAGFVFAGLACA